MGMNLGLYFLTSGTLDTRNWFRYFWFQDCVWI